MAQIRRPQIPSMTKEVQAGTGAAAPTADRSPAHALRVRVLSGSFIMLLSSVFVGAMNLIYNFAIAHALGADRFGHASVVYTMLMLLSSVTLSFQLVCSKFVARSRSHSDRVAIYRLLHRRAWLYSAGIGVALAAANPVISRYLNLPSQTFIYLLAIAVVFYVPLGVRRGLLQGTYDFRPLAANFAVEVIVKLAGALVLVKAGYGVEGVVLAMTVSVLTAYLVAVPRRHGIISIPRAKLSSAIGEGVQAITFFIGQVVINNLDIILVKHFFDPTAAGIYAAVALAGRVVYMLSWSVVSSMFPFSAGVRSEEQGGRAVLGTALLLVGSIAGLFVFAMWAAPPGLWQILLGHGFPVPAHRFYSSLLVLYSLTSGIYSLAVVLMTYEISRKIGNVSWLQLVFSGAIVAGIYIFHHSLEQVILVQLALMIALLLVVSAPFLRARTPEAIAFVPPLSGIRKVKRVSEDEAIAEFLKREFYLPEFNGLRETYAAVVSNPDFSCGRENQLRKALLFHRRGRLWRELPADTEWWEVELNAEQISRTRIFARNQWLRYASRDFLLLSTADSIRDRLAEDPTDPFLKRLQSLSEEVAGNSDRGYDAIILIAVDEQSPLTIIEGNHRMTAAALIKPEALPNRFRFLCGFSPHMTECVWYQTGLSTLWRYTWNTLIYYLRDRRKLSADILNAAEQARS